MTPGMEESDGPLRRGLSAIGIDRVKSVFQAALVTALEQATGYNLRLNFCGAFENIQNTRIAKHP